MQLNREEIKKELINILIAQNNTITSIVNTVTDKSNLRTDVGLDSIQMLYLVIVIEEKFNIQFDNVGLGDFVTLGDIISFIEKQSS